jgi:hypothetical protein
MVGQGVGLKLRQLDDRVKPSAPLAVIGEPA